MDYKCQRYYSLKLTQVPSIARPFILQLKTNLVPRSRSRPHSPSSFPFPVPRLKHDRTFELICLSINPWITIARTLVKKYN
jgi:hypothetical protein